MELSLWNSESEFLGIKNPQVRTDTNAYKNCDRKDNYIMELEEKVEKMQAENAERQAGDGEYPWVPCNSGKMPDGGQAVLIRLKNGCGGIDGINDTDNSPYDISFVRVEDNNKWVSSCGTYPLKDVIAWKEIESYKP